MIEFKDYNSRIIRFTDERYTHIEENHPEMIGQLNKIEETLIRPESVVKSTTDDTVNLFYRKYNKTPVTQKYMCITVKVLRTDAFIITAYFTDSIKSGELIWTKK